MTHEPVWGKLFSPKIKHLGHLNVKQIVPSMTDPDKFYEVDSETMSCTCPAYQKGLTRPCKHLIEAFPDKIKAPTMTKMAQWAGEIRYLGGWAPEHPLLALDTQQKVERWADDQLDQWMTEELVAYDVHVNNSQAKWRLASGVQKAVRRNKPNSAAVLAYGLFHVDRPYLYYRLAVIAVEDVGIGNIPVITALFRFLRRAAQIRKTCGADAEWKIVRSLVIDMALGPKDRNSTEISVVAKLGNASPDMVGLLDTWLTEVSPVNRPVTIHAFKAAVSLAKNPESRPLLLDAYQRAGVPAAVTYCAGQSLAKMKYLLGAGLGMVWQLALVSPTQIVRDDPDLLDDGQIGAYTGATFDKHTSEGKRAVKYWLKSCPEIEKYVSQILKPETSVSEAVGMLLFDWEGSRCRRRLDYEGSATLQRLAQMRIDSFVIEGNHGQEFAETYLYPNYSKLLKARIVVNSK